MPLETTAEVNRSWSLDFMQDVLYCGKRFRILNVMDEGAAVVHIFRIEGKQIVELWDVGQLIPEDSPNENGIF